MRHRTANHFRERYSILPSDVQALAEKSYLLLKTDPGHPSLHFKKVGEFWSARIGLTYRALAVKDGEDFLWVWIGTHDEYSRIVKGR